MGLVSRQICECLRAHPELTAAQIALRLDANAETLRKLTRRLVEQGYVESCRRERNGMQLRLTGKPFPSVANWKPGGVCAARLRMQAIDDAIRVLVPAMRAMVMAGHEAA